MIIAIIAPFTAVLAVSLLVLFILTIVVSAQLYYYVQHLDQPAGLIGHSVWFVLTCLAILVINSAAYRNVNQGNMHYYLAGVIATMIVFFTILPLMERFIYKINHYLERRKHLHHA